MESEKTFRQRPLAYFLGIMLYLESHRTLTQSLLKLKFCIHYAPGITLDPVGPIETSYCFLLRAFWSPCSFLFFFFFSFRSISLSTSLTVKKGNLNIHPITCIRRGSCFGSASGFSSLLDIFSLLYVYWDCLPFAYFGFCFSSGFHIPTIYLLVLWAS